MRRVYGHLGTVRQRSEIVEYRLEQFTEALADRLHTLRAGGFATIPDTTPVPSVTEVA